MIRPVLGSRASIGGVLGSGRGGAAAAWYLAGGVSAANCVAAYAPKGAASLAASYIDLTGNGNNAAPGVAPTLGTNGWTFDGNAYLTTNVVPASGWSMLIRFSGYPGSTDRFLAGAWATSPSNSFFMIALRTVDVRYYAGSGNSIRTPVANAAVLGFGGQQPYRNGSADGSAISGTWQTMPGIYIGTVNQAGTPSTFYAKFVGDMQAVSIYDTTPTATQIGLISAAMAAL